MTPLAGRRANRVGRQSGTDCDSPPSPKWLVVPIFAAVGLGELVAFATYHVAGPLWGTYLHPTPSSTLAFLKRVGLATDDVQSVGAYSLFMWCLVTLPQVPEILMVTLVGFLIGWAFPRCFLRLTIALVIGECLTQWVLLDWMESPYVVAYAFRQPTTSTKLVSLHGNVLRTAAIYGPPFLAAWIASRWSNRRALKGHCVKCDYLLRGLPTARCPECGTPF